MKTTLPTLRINQLVALALILSVVLLMISSTTIAAQEGVTPVLESANATAMPPLPEAAGTADATPTAGAESAPEVVPVGEPICGPTRHVSGDITADTWWDAGYVYVLDGDVTVKPGVTLRIDASVIKASSNTKLIINGRLLAVGTKDFPHYFTSLRDDTLCGDTNGDGGATTPSTGDWGWIQFNPGSSPDSILQRAVIRYGGYCKDYNCYWQGEVHAPIRLINVMPILANLTFTKGFRNAVEIPAQNWSTSSWSNTTVIHWLYGDNAIPLGSVLTLAPDLKVKLSGSSKLQVNGKLLADGTQTNPVVFTSEKDDTVCGVGAADEPICDTNNDGESSIPATGDWGWIQFNEGSSADSLLRRVVIRYGGYCKDYNCYWQGEVHAPIRLMNAMPILANLTFTKDFRNAVEIPAQSWSTSNWNNTTVVYWLYGDNTVPLGSVLTLAPDLKLKFSGSSKLQVSGKLLAYGTQADPVMFTSEKDDTVCGVGASDELICDTNNDGESSEPAMGDWGWIQFNAGSGSASVLRRAVIRYGGYCKDYNCYWQGESHAPVRLIDVMPTLANLTFTKGFRNAVEIPSQSWSTSTWNNTTVVHWLYGDNTVPLGNVLTLAPDLKLKLSGSSKLQINGKLMADGTQANPVIFTSEKDDTVCGIGAADEPVCDTNNDSESSAPTTGDWGWIQFNEGSSPTSVLRRAVVRYGGYCKDYNCYWQGESHAPVRLINVMPTLTNITFTKGYRNAVEIPSQSWSTSSWNNTSVVYWLAGDNTIPLGSVLTLVPGLKLKVAGSSKLLVNGKLLADGTQSSPVLFTSEKDDTICGVGAGDEPICDTNNDDQSSAPETGDWGWIQFNSGSSPTSVLRRAVIRYGGYCKDYNCYWQGEAHAPVRLINVMPTLANITFAKDYRNAAEIAPQDWSTSTWNSSSVVLWLGGDVTFPRGNILTIEAGGKVKIPRNVKLNVGGKLVGNGTDIEPILMVSEKDDSVCGTGSSNEPVCDTNNDEKGSQPAIGDWGWIQFGSASDPSSILNRVIIRHGGYCKDYNCYWQGESHAVVRLAGVSPTITHVRFDSNYSGLDVLDGALPSLTCNDFQHNQSHGIYNNQPATPVTAEGQWWGSSSGPQHASNPTGTGDRVSDGVDFTPWAIFPCTDVPLPGAQGTLRFSPGSIYNPSQPIWFFSTVKNTTATPYTFRVIMRLLRDGAVVDTQSLDVNLAGGNSSVLSHNFDVRSTGQYQVRGELWLGGMLLAARSADVTVLDAGAQRVAEEYATELKQTAREEFDQMADIPAKIIGRNITDWGWDKIESLFGNYFGEAAAPAKEADPTSASDANVEKGLQEGRKLLDDAGEKVRLYTATRLRTMIYQRTSVLLPEWFDPLNPEASLSDLTDDMKDRVKKIITEETSAVVKEYFFKAGFTEPQMRQIEARDGQFNTFLLGHPVAWTPALEGIFNRGRDAIRNTVESDAIVTLGPVDILGRTVRYDVTLLEQQRKYDEVKQLKGALGTITQALTVVGVVLAILIFIGAIVGTGGLATTLLPLLWKMVAFLGKVKSVLIPLALTFLTVSMAVSVPILAPRVTVKHDQTLDQVEATAGAAGAAAALSDLIVVAKPGGKTVQVSGLLTNASAAEQATPVVETTIYSVDGRVVQVLWARPTLAPTQSARLDKELSLPAGEYRAVTALHTANGVVGEPASQQFTVSSPEIQVAVRLDRNTFTLGQPIHASVTVTNTDAATRADNLTLVLEASDGQNFQAWPLNLAAGQTWQTNYSFVPPAEGSYLLRASISAGFDALAAADASYVVGSGPSLALQLSAQGVYQSGADVILPLVALNNGNAASTAVLKAVTLNRLGGLTAIYTATLPLNLPAGGQTTANLVALPAALAQPGLYSTRLFLGDQLYRTLDYAIAAQDTLFADISPDQAYHNQGDPVALTVAVFNAAYAPTDAAVTVAVQRPDGVSQPITMNAVGTGRYQGSITASLTGTYQATVTVSKPGYRTVGNATFFVAGQRSQLIPSVEGQPLLGVSQPLTVTIRNERNAPIPDATLTVSNSTELLTIRTDLAGQAVVQLSPSVTETYHVTIEKMGFDLTLDEWPVWVGEDVTPPPLFVDVPAATNRTSLTINGLTEPGVSVSLNGQTVTVDARGRFIKAITLAAGANTLTFTAKDGAGNTATVARTVTLDTTPPNLTVSEPADGLNTSLEAIRVSGVTEPAAVVTVNDAVAVVNPTSSAFSAWVVLRPGVNSIVVTATDPTGNVRTVTRRVNRALRVYLPLVRR